jgi:single-strand DNA-binding protein
MNVVVLIGRMVADPELKYTPSGAAVCSFRVAVDRRFKSESGEKEADFIDIVAWK